MRAARIALALILMLVSVGAWADWREHDDLPEWAQRGRLQWTLIYGAPGATKLQIAVDAAQDLVQGPSFADADEDARAVIEAGGLHDMKYLPRTWDYAGGKLLEDFPYLADAEARMPDGSRLILYHQQRYTGCENQPGYLRHRKLELAANSTADCIFFDTTSILACHCDACRAKFRSFSREAIGRELDLPDYERTRRGTLEERVHKLFCVMNVVDYFAQVRSFLSQYDPAPLVCPNLHINRIEHQVLMMKGVPDLVFFEESGHPPMTRKFMGYKMALALTHGRPTGQLIYLDASERSARGWKFTSTAHAGEERPDWMAYILPDEIAAATAEAAAAGGDYIEGYAITPMYPLLDPTKPMVTEDQAAINTWSGFQAKHEDLLTDTRPGSRIGLLYSVWTAMWHLEGAQNKEGVCDTLMRAGLPFEMLVEDDLTPEALADYEAIFLPNIICLSAESVRALHSYVEGGGALLITGDFATEGWLDPAGPEAPELSQAMAGGEAGVREVGAGHVYWDPRALPDIPADEVRARLTEIAGDPAVSFAPGSADVVVNVMRSVDGRTLQAHLINYDFDYEELWPGVRDDDGHHEARMPFTRTVDRAEKILIVDDPAQLTHPAVSFSGDSPSRENYSLVVSVNGTDIATLPAEQFVGGGWHSVPFDRALLKATNEVVIRAIGSPNAHPDYFNLRIDTDAPGGRSLASDDEGQTWSADLSPWDRGEQAGEYLIRITQERDEGERISVERLMASYTVNPTPPLTLTVRDLPGDLRAVAISADHEPLSLEVSREGDVATVTVPPTRIGNIVVVTSDGALAEGLARGQ